MTEIHIIHTSELKIYVSSWTVLNYIYVSPLSLKSLNSYFLSVVVVKLSIV